MKEYRLVINLNDSSITTKQVGEEGLFKIRKVDGFRAYPCESKSDVQEYFDKIKTDCFNVTNFTKDTFNVILLSECSNQEIVDAVKAEIQDTTFTVLDSTFSKAFNSDDNNAEDLDELNKRLESLTSKNDELSSQINDLNEDKELLKQDLEKETELLKQSQEKISALHDEKSIFQKFLYAGSLVQFGKDPENNPLHWLVYNIEDNNISLFLLTGFNLGRIENLKKNRIDDAVIAYLNGIFLTNFTEEECKLMQVCQEDSESRVVIPDENELMEQLLPKIISLKYNSLEKLKLDSYSNKLDQIIRITSSYEPLSILVKDEKFYDCGSNDYDFLISRISGFTKPKEPMFDKIVFKYASQSRDVEIHPIIKLSIRSNSIAQK